MCIRDRPPPPSRRCSHTRAGRSAGGGPPGAPPPASRSARCSAARSQHRPPHRTGTPTSRDQARGCARRLADASSHAGHAHGCPAADPASACPTPHAVGHPTRRRPHRRRPRCAPAPVPLWAASPRSPRTTPSTGSPPSPSTPRPAPRARPPAPATRRSARPAAAPQPPSAAPPHASPRPGSHSRSSPCQQESEQASMCPAPRTVAALPRDCGHGFTEYLPSHQSGRGSRRPPPPIDRHEHGTGLARAIESVEQQGRSERRAVAEQTNLEPLGEGVRVVFDSVPDFDLKLATFDPQMRGLHPELLGVTEVVTSDGATIERATVFVPEGQPSHFVQRFEQYLSLI